MTEKLIESLDAEQDVMVPPAWRDEVYRRCREVDEESVELRDTEDVFTRDYTRLE